MSTKVDSNAQQPGSLKDNRLLDLKEKESTANKLLKFAGSWKGNDLEQCLEEVYKTRGETTF